ncbi:DUF4258 domain-containing protein [Neisseria sp. S1]|uniref:DUF4258 domain-containing protein n=1 Tax=Neisseria sp. S1 TaxID=3318354 RepID=UPI003A86129E
MAATDGKVFYTAHAEQRMLERSISRIMVHQCLLAGISEAHRHLVHNTDYHTYECRLSHYMAGVNYDVVAAINPADPTAIVVTVINTEE